ncbi:MAG: sugar phosphate isomerase/epimerase [Pseudomonadota bacterium]
MNVEFYRPFWGAIGTITEIAVQAKAAGFNGLEGHVPEEPGELQALNQVTKEHDLKFIPEICTGGSDPYAYWVPIRSATVDDHIASFESELKRVQACEMEIPFINCMGGLDAWSLDDSLRFFEQALSLSDQYNYLVSFETHRTRCFYSPWSTYAILQAMPEIPVTTDLSHWCVVSERLIDEEEGLQAVIERAHHIQCRVGYDQGPQVPQPAAPEYERFVSAHQGWWEKIWLSQKERGFETITMTPEYGSDDYLHLTPYSKEPVADLWEVVQWSMQTEQDHFNNFFNN